MNADGSMLWLRLAQFDIRLRYRNSTFGPLWITLNTAIFAASVGFLYAVLLNQPIKEFLHHLAVSIVLWQFFSASVVEGAETIINSHDLILNTKISPASCVLRSVTKNFIILLHNIIVVFVTMIIAYPNIGLNFPMFAVGVSLLAIHATWAAFIVAIISVRFRDVPLITTSAMQLLFMLSPILWTAKILPSNSPFLVLNPIAYMIDAARTPILNGGTDYTSVAVSAAIAAFGAVAAYLLYRRTERRIPYWL
ncbi:ABC transporter permease [Mesorhizobium sp. ES1-3]|uniref:ABC transporter permease n=1 Tax=Mesorhizobium sp. ES1-3 TaxID=2876628 RepID=UPI001CD02F7A|nr:ABC transporter permease [Mesorhizobium sp. ES1-3]MBZ9672572.1 ABC transporter permease [Mesorhizobium sp. ES1-3]